MGMSPCYMLMRGLLIVLSIIFLVAGLCVCGVCVWGVYYGGVSSRAGAAGLWGCLGAAVASLLAALLAGWGAMRRGRGALAGGAALGALVAAAAAAAAVWAAHHHHELRGALLDHMREHLTQHYGVMDLHTKLLDTIQEDLQCCGVEGPRDWSSSLYSAGRQAAAGAEAGAVADAKAGAVAAHSAPLDLSVGAPSSYYYVPASCCNRVSEPECGPGLPVPLSAPPAAVWGAGCGAAVWGRLRQAGAPLRGPAAALLAAAVLHALLAAALAVHTHTHNRYKA